MCWLTESWHINCSHWGPRQVETACARGEATGSVTGCWENTITGVSELPVLCPSCRYRAEMTTPLQVTHASVSTTSLSSDSSSSSNDDAERVPVRKLSQPVDEERVRKEKELIAEWEARWTVKQMQWEGGKGGMGLRGRKARYGKWAAWRGFK
ncbi:hypothetical protein DL95DRAFT_478124 [Leptodontidium sp. 2 PMI_412]|nr:hypothetical protein DL95DRAFT_478124 [Leptodontidium sp. 2 PMI_412]